MQLCLGTRTLVPPHFFGGIFWWCTHIYACSLLREKNRKCHKYTWEKDKLIFLMSILEITIKNSCQLERAPEFWCPGTRTLVPFKVDNRFFVLISKMGFRNINLSFFPSVFMCSRHFLFLLEHCQHKWEYTIKKTPKKMGGHQSSGARAVDVSGSTWAVVSVARDGKDWWRGSLSGQFRSFLSVRTKFPKNLICKIWQQMFIKDWKTRQNWP